MDRRRYKLSDLCWYILWCVTNPGPVMTDDRERSIVPDPDGVKPFLPKGKTCSMTDPMIACDERKASYRRGEFGPDFELDAWVFNTDYHTSTREPTDRAIWTADRGNYTGEPFRWHCCPFCGKDLPNPGYLKRMHEKKAWGDKQPGDGS